MPRTLRNVRHTVTTQVFHVLNALPIFFITSGFFFFGLTENLCAQSATITVSSIPTTVAGGVISVNWTVTNTRSSSRTFGIGGEIWQGSTKKADLGQQTTSTIAANSTGTGSFTYTIPSDFSGSYIARAAVWTATPGSSTFLDSYDRTFTVTAQVTNATISVAAISTVVAGDGITVSYTVQNTGNYSRTFGIGGEIWQGSTKKADLGQQTTSTIAANSTGTGSFTYTIPSDFSGSYIARAAVWTATPGSSTFLDSYDRNFDVSGIHPAEIVSFTPPYSAVVLRGTELQATVQVKNNSASARSFWVGLSFSDPTASDTSWPIGYYDIQPLRTPTIDPGQTKSVVFTFAPHRNLIPGQYYAIARTWDRFNEQLYLMEEPIDNTYNNASHPEWTTSGHIGLASFSLASYDGPSASLLGQIEYAINKDYFKTSTLTDLYLRRPNAEKPLLLISAGSDGTLFGVPVQAGGSIVIDLADLLNISPEGSNWVTVWLDANGTLGYNASLPVKVDISVIPHEFNFYERALADQRSLLTVDAGIIAVPGLVFTALSCDASGCVGPRLHWNGSASISLSVIGVNATLISREVNKNILRNIFLNNPSGISSISQLRDYLVSAFKGFTGSVRNSTLDDGDWELFNYQREVPLQLGKAWNETSKAAHYFFIDVPTSATQLKIQTSGGTGNVDLYVERGSRPTSITVGGYDYKSTNPGNADSITIQSPQAGRWYIMLPTSTSYSSVELLARVTTATSTNSIALTAPNGGEVWQWGTTHAVTWTSQGNPGTNVTFDLYRDNGSTFDRTIVASLSNNGSYNWPIAQDLPERSDYRVRITSTSDQNIYGQSERSFSIIAPSTQAVLSVTPATRSVDSSSGTTTFSVSNAGSGTLAWNASVISGNNWLSISSGLNGTNSGTISVSFSQNSDSSPRTGSIRIEASDANESPKDVTVTQGGTTTFVEQLTSEIPSEFHLSQNYPNPFNPVTTIEFSIPKSAPVILTIFNSLGMEIEVLVNQYLPPGRYRTQWAAQNMPSGVYFCRIRSAEFTETKKLILLR